MSTTEKLIENFPSPWWLQTTLGAIKWFHKGNKAYLFVSNTYRNRTTGTSPVVIGQIRFLVVSGSTPICVLVLSGSIRSLFWFYQVLSNLYTAYSESNVTVFLLPCASCNNRK